LSFFEQDLGSQDLHASPTRRASDLAAPGQAAAAVASFVAELRAALVP